MRRDGLQTASPGEAAALEVREPVGASPQRGRSYWALSLRRLLRKKLAVVCLGIIVLLYGSGILAAAVTPYDYNDQDLSVAKQGPSFGHPFGTDPAGP